MQTFRSDADYYKTTLSKCLCRTSPREYIVQEDCPRVSILPGLDEGKSRSRSCQRTAHGAPQRLLLCGIVGRESLYRTTVMGTLTHTGWSKATWSGPRRFRYKTSPDLLKLSIFVVNSEAWVCWLLMYCLWFSVFLVWFGLGFQFVLEMTCLGISKASPPHNTV